MAALNYIIQFNLIFSILIGIYYLGLRNNADFNFNRIYLLAIAGFSIFTPLLNIPVFGSMEILYFPLLSDNGEAISAVDQTSLLSVLTTQELIALIYASLSLIFIIVLLVKIVKLCRHVHKMKTSATFDEANNIYILKSAQAPFTFLKWSFIPKALQQEKEASMIIAHEKSHAEGLHSIDIMIAELMSCLLFINPAKHYYKKFIAENHEYLADAAVVQPDNQSEYTEILIKQTLYPAQLGLVSFFAKPTIFNRINMMKNTKRNLKKQYVAVTAGLLFISVMACDFQSEETIAKVQEQPGNVEVKEGTDKIFTNVDTPSEPAYGIDDFFEHLKDELSDKYPKQAQRLGVEGTVYIQFTVEKDGSLSNLTPVKGIGAGCDQAAVNALASYGKWIPASHQGITVRSQRIVPIKFTLD